MLHVGLLGVGESDTCIHSFTKETWQQVSRAQVVSRHPQTQAPGMGRLSLARLYCGLYLYAYAWRDHQPHARRPRPHATPSAAAPRQPLRNPEKAKRQGPLHLFPFRSFHDDPAPTDRPLPMPSCPHGHTLAEPALSWLVVTPPRRRLARPVLSSSLPASQPKPRDQAEDATHRPPQHLSTPPQNPATNPGDRLTERSPSER
jgi:hypothetical protein